MNAERISSRQHPFVQRCRRVARRLDTTAVLLDGEHLIAEALAAGLSFDGVLSDSRSRPIVTEIARRGVAHLVGTDAVLEAASPVRTPSGLVALARWSPVPVDRVLANADGVVVAMWGVQDPGNVGGIVRTVYALGGSGVIALEGTAAPDGWKALRGAMGATFRLPVGVGTLEDLAAHASAVDLPLIATVAHGGELLAAEAVPRRAVILLGNEGEGLSAHALGLCTHQIRIPLSAGAESLNVGATAAILLWELRPR